MKQNNASGFIAMLLITILLASCSKAPTNESPQVSDSLSAEVEEAMKTHSVDPWYPLVIDSLYGGYLSDLNYRWELQGPQNKMIVSQARHIWTCSKLAEFYPRNKNYLAYAAHGFKFLKEKMWDQEFGGFYNLVDQKGQVIADNDGSISKNAYGNAFAIYGLAAYYKESGDQQALELSKRTFQWLEQHSYDPSYPGYFQFLARDGTPFMSGSGNVPPKDQNSTIHLLEAFTELYQVWPDDTLRNRLQTLMLVIRDTITTEKGYMNLFFNRDWTPVSYRDSTEEARAEHFELDHVSFGHDVETAYLLLEASEVLGIENDTTTLRKAKIMVDHALENGWDQQVGGIYDGGYYFNDSVDISIIRDTKVWWAQAEALNTFLMMADLFPDDQYDYYEKFVTQWNYVQRYLLDDENNGWYWGGLDKEPDRENAPKAQIWKVNYHTVRSMMNCVKRLRSGPKDVDSHQ